MTEIVNHYGAHFAAGVGFLMQQGFDRSGKKVSRGTNAIGSSIPPPFTVRPVRRTMDCPHNISLVVPKPTAEQWSPFELAFMSDPLVRAMLPIPKPGGAGGLYLGLDDRQAREFHARINLLAQMSSPLQSPVQPLARYFGPQQFPRLLDQLSLTNVQPLVLHGATLRREVSETLDRLGGQLAGLPRRLVVAGVPDLPTPGGFERLGRCPALDMEMAALTEMSWGVLGAQVLRMFLRGEWEDPAP